MKKCTAFGNISPMPIIVQASNIGGSLDRRYTREFLQGHTLLEFLIGRLVQRYAAASVILAISSEPDDDFLEASAQKYGINIYRGDYGDILLRLSKAVAAYGNQSDSFIRIHANSPLVDFGMMEDLAEKHVIGGYEYSYNEHLHGALWGTGCEVFSSSLVHKLARMRLRRNQMIALGCYLRQNQQKYKVHEYPFLHSRPGYKVNVETERDFSVVRELARNLSEINCENVISYLDAHEVLADYNRMQPPKETGTEKLFLSPEKVNHVCKQETVDFSYPISVELTLTNRCNLRCSYCSDMELRRRQGMMEQLERDVLFRLFDDLARGGTKGVVLEGGGEPTLYPDFPEIVRCARHAGLAVGLITNGTQRLDKELLCDFEWIRVSLDASTAEEYKELKGVDAFEQVISNIAFYAQTCPSVGVGYVVTNRNVSQIEPLVLRLRELHVSYIQCRPVVDSRELYPEDVDLSYLQYYQTAEFGVMVDGMVENAEGGNHGLPCRAHSITSIISGDGSVYICGRLNIYDWLEPIGNIVRESFHAIWNGDRRRKQAKMVMDAGFCKENCPQCRISKFNVLVDRLSQIKSVDFI